MFFSFLRQFPFSFDSTFISKFYFIILNFKSSRKWLQKTCTPSTNQDSCQGWDFEFVDSFSYFKWTKLYFTSHIFLLQKVSWSEPFEGTCRHCSFPIVHLDRPLFVSILILWLDFNSAKCRATHLVKWNVEMPSDISLEKCSAVVLFNCQELVLFQNSFFKSW